MKPEDRFVEKLRSLLSPSEDVLLGPGDDAAVVREEGGPIVATTDLLVETVDFLPGEDAEVIGRRAVAVNLSDLAAMGARPRWFLLSIGFPTRRGEGFPLEVARGAVARAGEFGARLVGGDISSSPVTLVSVAMWGKPEAAPITRSGASPGESLYVTGYPGRAAAGLRLARRLEEFSRHGAQPIPRFGGLSTVHVEELLRAYRDPEPRVALGAELAGSAIATAAIDLSDGLGADAGRLARASGVHLEIEASALPVASSLRAFSELEDVSPVELIVSGGDDYELLFAASEAAGASVQEMAGRAGVIVSRIGRVAPGAGVTLRQGRRERDISDAGFDHFEAGR